MGLFCYDFSKCTMISLAAVAISLTIGLVSIAYGQIAGLSPEQTEEFYKGYCEQYNAELKDTDDSLSLEGNRFYFESINESTTAEEEYIKSQKEYNSTARPNTTIPDEFCDKRNAEEAR